jgi:hypothetical protein
MKYQLMLSNLEDQRKPIIQLQTKIRFENKMFDIPNLSQIGLLHSNLLHNQFQTCFRQMVCQLRAKERAIFAIQQQNEGNLDAQHEVSARSSIRFIFKGSFL